MRLIFWLSLIILAVSTAACSGGQSPTGQPSAGLPATRTAPASADSSPSPLPPTATPPPGKVLLIAASEGSAEQAILRELAQSSSWKLEVRPSLSTGDLTPEIRVVVLLHADDSLSALASGAAQVQFVAMGSSSLKPSANLSVIRPARDQQGFMAGYIAAMLTPDWKVGVISVSDANPGIQARQGFLAGARYFCGICLPKYPPYAGYPLYEEISMNAVEADRQAAADALLAKKVQTVYVTGEASTPQLLDYLAKSGVNLLGDYPPTEAARGQWLATVSVDASTALRTLWPDVSAGKGGADLAAPLTVGDINTGILSEGRLRLVNETLGELQNGLIAPVQVP